MEKPRILIAGAHGFVGARVRLQYPEAGVLESALLRAPGEGLREAVREYRPDVIINAAAISDIGTCEKDPEGSYLANVTLPTVLAQAAAEAGARLISFSSDQVYTGCAEPGPYGEEMALPVPPNVYARHKLEAEGRVLDACPNSVLLRATWMYDLPLYGHNNRGNFLVNTLEAVLRREPVSVPGGTHRGITYVRQVVENLNGLFTVPAGVYNYGSENPLNMASTAQALLNALGAEAEVRDTGVKRHNLWMDCKKAAAQGVVFDTTKEGFRRCLKDYGFLK